MMRFRCWPSAAGWSALAPAGDLCPSSRTGLAWFAQWPVKPDVVLEVGTGSGYQAAVLAEVVREVYSIELIESLGTTAAARLAEMGYRNVEVKIGDGYAGWAEKAPFDGIVVTAAAPQVSRETSALFTLKPNALPSKVFEPLRVVAVHAHPDDETLATGVALAHHVARGDTVHVVTATLGEEGEVIPADLAHLEGSPELGPHRRGELDRAMAELGVEAAGYPVAA